ncbi:MAG: Asp-tRNA(Asn)/Glu-tRNA(Gln) amidotransferase subunit GatB [Candidatus Nealsonbacteria bacterium]|nr:Asp-tRNA(Asn)/Glu-tRNA(Gln) amidotransferase subunit GatB [Candidatus Nealsonbacteria bacterium]
MYKPTLGIEAHVQLKTKSKMFCSCRNNPNERHPNVLICPTCLGHPGTLPVINQEAVRKTIKTGLALNCQIPEYSKFDRKNYFYPDLPKGYQISQLYEPFCKNGFLEINGKKIRIREAHLEEDTGKLIHPKGADYSLVDFNRAGIPLMELVTEPDITSAKEARKFAEELQLILRYLDVSNADMEKGELRIEVNISLTKTSKLGTKVEIKNINSFRAVEKGIDYEIKRQAKILNSGTKVIQETRGWHDAKKRTFSQRKKEETHDYRYFPEPDLPLLRIAKEFIHQIKAEIPELPQQRRERFKKEYEIEDKDIEIFVYNKKLGEYFEKAASELINWVKETERKNSVEKDEFTKLVKLCSNYIISDLQGLIKKTPYHFFEKKEGGLITPENFAEFACLIYKDKISSKIAKMVLSEMFLTGADPSQIIEEKELTQIANVKELAKIIKEVLSKNPKPVQDYKKGKQNAFQFLIGQIMAQSKGKANPQIVRKLLLRRMSEATVTGMITKESTGL